MKYIQSKAFGGIIAVSVFYAMSSKSHLDDTDT